LLKKVGDRLTIVGVAHVLPKSTTDVKAVIERERPEIVAVELCPNRYAALTNKGQQLGAIGALRLGQLKPFIINKLFHAIQNKFARQTGMPVGEEMLTAIEHAKKAGARVELIDRDIGITIQRLNYLVSRQEKIRLLGELLVGLLPFAGDRINFERLTEDQTTANLISTLKQKFPTMHKVLIEERDEFMATRVTSLLASSRGKIVCVVGAGHVPGLYRRLASQLEGGWQTRLEYPLEILAGPSQVFD
jgi:pheromone shutdown-related protein TraB